MLGMTALCAPAAERSGKAAVEWLTVSATCEPGGPIQTAIRLVVDPGWHTYWFNPGDGGMKTSVEWKLPPGWTATEPAHPVPKRFLTGGLHGFGYEGTVDFPVTLTPPADFTGEANLEAAVSWLTCAEDGCVPGEATVKLTLKSGPPAPGRPAAAAIAGALKRIPVPLRGARLEVVENPASLSLTIAAKAGAGHDLSRYDVFPATPQVVDPAAVIRFAKSGDSWTATVPKCGYAASPVRQLTLVLADGRGAAFELTWRAR